MLPVILLRTAASIVLCILIVAYTIKLLRRLKRGTVVAGRIFLSIKKIEVMMFSVFIAVILVHVFTVTLLAESYIIREIGRYLAVLSLPFFLYALYKLHEVIK